MESTLGGINVNINSLCMRMTLGVRLGCTVHTYVSLVKEEKKVRSSKKKEEEKQEDGARHLSEATSSFNQY